MVSTSVHDVDLVATGSTGPSSSLAAAPITASPRSAAPLGAGRRSAAVRAGEGGTDILSGAIRHVFVRATELAAQNIRVGGFGALGKRVLRRPVEGDERLLSATPGAGGGRGGGG